MKSASRAPLKRIPLSPSNESLHMLVLSDLILDPPYQRGSVWGVTRQRNLWFSLLSGVHVGVVVLNVREDNSVVVVDGKQRIEAAHAFLSGNLTLPAWWFPQEALTVERDENAMVSWGDLTRLGQGMCQRPGIAVQRTELGTVEEEALLFDLINFGGVPQGETDEDLPD